MDNMNGYNSNGYNGNYSQNNYASNPGVNGYQTQQPMNNGKVPKFVMWLVFGIIQVLCCNQITGVLTIVFDCLARNAYKAGNFADYYSKLKVCKIATIIGVIIGIVVNIVVIIYTTTATAGLIQIASEPSYYY